MLNALANILLSAAMAIAGGGAVREAVEDAQSAGYDPCIPTVVDAAAGWTHLGFGEMPVEVAGWAAWPEAFGVCMVGLTPDTVTSEDPTWLRDVAQHEVCHLSVGVAIDARTDRASFEDPHHDAPDFKECMARMREINVERDVSTTDNGEGDLPTCPDPYNGWCSVPDAVVLDTRTGATTEVRNLTPDPTYTDADHCADLHEVKPWIPCE